MVSLGNFNANEVEPASDFDPIAKLEAKLVQKNEVVAELLEEHVKLKKELGEL